MSATEKIQAGERYLSFSLGAEEYAIPLLAVKEVIALPSITPIPGTPSHFLGIFNLRGRVISIIDLRTKLGIKPNANSEIAVIICDLESIVLGVVVDSINSVVAPEAGEISEQPELQSSHNTAYISGIYKKDAHLIVLMNIEKAIGVEDFKIASAQSSKLKAA